MMPGVAKEFQSEALIDLVVEYTFGYVRKDLAIRARQ
jgi:hypothetical protein